jgi:hypothetical protein
VENTVVGDAEEENTKPPLADEGEEEEMIVVGQEAPTPSAGTVTFRTVQILHPDRYKECMAYDTSLSEAAVSMIKCSTSNDTVKNDHWEVIITNSTSDLFHLRHKESQLCIPQNPEHPDQPFDCFRYSGNDEAIADSINGLVNCDSGFAATMGWSGITNTLYLYNTDCITAAVPGNGTDVIFMSYKRVADADQEQSDRVVVMWGEQILLDLQNLVDQFDFQGEWMFRDVPTT